MTEQPPEVIISEMLRAQGLTVGVVESSTGGLIGHRVTEVSGSSDYFVGSIVPYSRDVQKRLVGVAPATLETHGVVSEQMAREMAYRGRRRLRADVCVSVTGIASPHSGRSTKPIGLTYIGLSAEDIETCERHIFEGDRSENKWQSAEAALDFLRLYLDRRRELSELQQIVDGVDPEDEPQLAMIQPAASGIIPPGARSERQTVRNKLGILSSAFNPLTEAHAQMTELAIHDCRLDEVMLELSKVNVDKRVYGASLAERLWTLKHFAASQPALSVGLCGHARFIDKAKAVRTHYPTDTEIYFIVGYDTLVRVFDPKYYEDLEAELKELFDRGQFIVANRGQHGLANVEAFLQRPVCQPYADRIHPIELDEFHAGLSSTQVRDRLQQREPVTDLVPKEIVRLLPLTTLAAQNRS